MHLNTILHNSQNSKCFVPFCMEHLDDTIRSNLLRLIDKHADGNQRQFAQKVGIDFGLLNQIVNEHKDLGKVLIERICKALNILYIEFFREEKPVIAEEMADYGKLTDDEAQWLNIYRRAKGLSDERLEIMEGLLKTLGLILPEEELLLRKRA